MPKTKKIRKNKRSLKRKNMIKNRATKTIKNKKMVGGSPNDDIRMIEQRLENISNFIGPVITLRTPNKDINKNKILLDGTPISYEVYGRDDEDYTQIIMNFNSYDDITADFFNYFQDYILKIDMTNLEPNQILNYILPLGKLELPEVRNNSILNTIILYNNYKIEIGKTITYIIDTHNLINTFNLDHDYDIIRNNFIEQIKTSLNKFINNQLAKFRILLNGISRFNSSITQRYFNKFDMVDINTKKNKIKLLVENNFQNKPYERKRELYTKHLFGSSRLSPSQINLFSRDKQHQALPPQTLSTPPQTPPPTVTSEHEPLVTSNDESDEPESDESKSNKFESNKPETNKPESEINHESKTNKYNKFIEDIHDFILKLNKNMTVISDVRCREIWNIFVNQFTNDTEAFIFLINELNEKLNETPYYFGGINNIITPELVSLELKKLIEQIIHKKINIPNKNNFINDCIILTNVPLYNVQFDPVLTEEQVQQNMSTIAHEPHSKNEVSENEVLENEVLENENELEQSSINLQLEFNSEIFTDIATNATNEEKNDMSNEELLEHLSKTSNLEESKSENGFEEFVNTHFKFHIQIPEDILKVHNVVSNLNKNQMVENAETMNELLKMNDNIKRLTELRNDRLTKWYYSEDFSKNENPTPEQINKIKEIDDLIKKFVETYKPKIYKAKINDLKNKMNRDSSFIEHKESDLFTVENVDTSKLPGLNNVEQTINETSENNVAFYANYLSTMMNGLLIMKKYVLDKLDRLSRVLDELKNRTHGNQVLPIDDDETKREVHEIKEMKEISSYNLRVPKISPNLNHNTFFLDDKESIDTSSDDKKSIDTSSDDKESINTSSDDKELADPKTHIKPLEEKSETNPNMYNFRKNFNSTIEQSINNLKNTLNSIINQIAILNTMMNELKNAVPSMNFSFSIIKTVPSFPSFQLPSSIGRFISEVSNVARTQNSNNISQEDEYKRALRLVSGITNSSPNKMKVEYTINEYYQ